MPNTATLLTLIQAMYVPMSVMGSFQAIHFFPLYLLHIKTQKNRQNKDNAQYIAVDGQQGVRSEDGVWITH